MSKTKSIFLEVIQFAPILTLASSFIVTGEVDLERAATLFVISAGLVLVVTAIVLFARAKLNPILLGTNLWLLLGAMAFGGSILPLADLVNQFRGAGLFACVLAVGAVLSFGSDRGYAGIETDDGRVVNRASAVLLVLTVIALAWSLVWVESIRLGGGLPFIVLNVSRRVLLGRLSV